jgi:hypothetical protein
MPLFPLSQQGVLTTRFPLLKQCSNDLGSHCYNNYPGSCGLSTLYENVTEIHGRVITWCPALTKELEELQNIRGRHWGAWGEREYSSYSFSTSALDGGEWSVSRPGRALDPGKGPRYPMYSRLGGPQRWSGHRVQSKNTFASAEDRTSIARSSSP